MTSEQSQSVKEALAEVSNRLTTCLGHIQQNFNEVQECLGVLKEAGMTIQVCDHQEQMRTGYYKVDKAGFYAFWCKGCQSEQLIPESEVE